MATESQSAVRFSILMPVYNRERYAAEAIESIQRQTFLNFELIVIDDGSVDGTPQMLASYGSRIRLIRQPNQGPEVARKKAAAVARGEYLAMLDSDDLLLPCALEAYDRVLRAFHSPPLLIGSMAYFADGEAVPLEMAAPGRIQAYKFNDFLSKRIPVGLSNSRIVIRKALFDEVGGTRDSTPSTFHADDFHLILKAGTAGPCVILHQPPTVLYRSHGANSIRDCAAMASGVRSLVRAERRHEYGGGSARRLDRYACIGGVALLWVKYCWRGGFRGLALKLLWSSAPMGIAATWKKLLTKVGRPAQPIALPPA